MSAKKRKLPIFWSRSAERDLGRIYEYFRLRNAHTAGAMVGRIMETISHLMEQPRLGHPSKFSSDHNYRDLICDQFCIIYRIEKQKVLIMRIWDTRRNPEDFFMGETIE